MNVVNFKIPVSEKPAESTDQKTFTSQKLDWISAVVADHTLDSSDKLVAICIVQHVNDKNEFGCFPSDPCIADETALSVSTVIRARKHLRAAGWITWKRRMRSSLYWTHTGPMAAVVERQQALALARKDQREARSPAFPVLSPVTEHKQPRMHHGTIPDDPVLSPVTVHDLSPVTDKHLTTNTTKKEGRKKDSRDEDIASASRPESTVPEGQSITMTNQLTLIATSDFETWYRQYPRRTGKLKAEKEYAKALKSKKATREELLAGAARYAAEKLGEDPRFTKHPATWLSNGCWLDEPQSKSRGHDSIMAGLMNYCAQER